MKKIFFCLSFVLFSVSVAVYAGPPTETEFTRDNLTYSVDSVNIGKGVYEQVAVLTGMVDRKTETWNGPLIIAIPDTVEGTMRMGAPINGYKKYPVKKIGSDAFFNIKFGFASKIPFVEIVIPRTVTAIEDYALECNLDLYYSDGTGATYKGPICSFITIPENVQKIGKDVLPTDGAYSVTWLAKNCTSCETSLTGAKSITFGTMVETIPAKLCAGNTKISQVILPHSVTAIGEQAFAGCTNLSSLAIGAGCTTIESLAFAGCTDLTHIVCYADVPPAVAPYSFIDVPIDADVEVPCGQIALYAVADEWKYFWAFDEIIPYKAVAQSSNEEWGTACVDFNCAEATFTAAANEGFRFKQWSNGRLENPLIMPLSEDLELVAEFEDMFTAIENVEEQPLPFEVDYHTIILPVARQMTICDVAGRIVYSGERQQISLPSSGLYFVRIDNNNYKIQVL